MSVSRHWARLLLVAQLWGGESTYEVMTYSRAPLPAGIGATGALVLSILVVMLCSLGPATGEAAAHYSSRKAIWGPVTFQGRSAFPLYERLGVGIFEDTLRWNEIALSRPADPRDPNDPAYRWPANVDIALREGPPRRIRVLLQIIGTPRWANGGRPANWVPTDVRDLRDFATAAARRYPSIHLWMIWGEPTRSVNFEPLRTASPGLPLTPGQAAAPRRYARMLDAAYAALKGVSPRNQVIGGNTYTAGEIGTAQWIDNLRLPDGRPPRMDMYGHNPFSLREPDLSNPASTKGFVDFSDLRRLDRLVSRELARPRGRLRLPLFLSEWTVPTAPDREFNFHVDLPVQRRWIASAFRIVRTARFIYALGWVNLCDDPPRSAGGLLFANGQPKPGFLAFQAG